MGCHFLDSVIKRLWLPCWVLSIESFALGKANVTLWCSPVEKHMWQRIEVFQQPHEWAWKWLLPAMPWDWDDCNLGQHTDYSCTRASEAESSAKTLLDSWPAGTVREQMFAVFSCYRLGHVVMQQQRTDTPGKGWDQEGEVVRGAWSQSVGKKRQKDQWNKWERERERKNQWYAGAQKKACQRSSRGENELSYHRQQLETCGSAV